MFLYVDCLFIFVFLLLSCYRPLICTNLNFTPTVALHSAITAAPFSMACCTRDSNVTVSIYEYLDEYLWVSDTEIYFAEIYVCEQSCVPWPEVLRLLV